MYCNDMSLQVLFLSEGFAALCTTERPFARVYTEMDRKVRFMFALLPTHGTLVSPVLCLSHQQV